MNKEQRIEIMKLPDVEVLARTLYGEARNQKLEGIIAVANVITNRAQYSIKRYGIGITEVCLMKWQFSCWNDTDPNLDKLMGDIVDPTIYKCRVIANISVVSLLVDNTYGATHYHHKSITPYWSESNQMNRLVYIGDHIFYREVI